MFTALVESIFDKKYSLKTKTRHAYSLPLICVSLQAKKLNTRSFITKASSNHHKFLQCVDIKNVDSCAFNLSDGCSSCSNEELWRVINCKEDLHRKLGIFILPIVSDWTNVFIVTWLSYAEEELTYSLATAPDWLTKR